MLFFLFGEDSFRSRKKVVEIREKFLKFDPVGSGLTIFDWDDQKKQKKLADVLGTANLLSSKRLVIINSFIEYATEEERKELLKYLEKKEKSISEDKDLVVIFWEKKKPLKNGKLYKFLEKRAKMQNFEKLSGAELNKWIQEKMSTLGHMDGIEKSAMEELIVLTGGVTEILDKEIAKLVDLSENGMIRKEDIYSLVKPSTEINIFRITDAIANRRKKEAICLLQEYFEQKGDSFYLFSMIVYQFRNLLRVEEAKNECFGNEREISNILGAHPFVIKKSLQQLTHFSSAELRAIYHQLGEYDSKAKKGKIDLKLILFKFIAEL